MFSSSFLSCSPIYLMILLPRFHLLLFHSLFTFFSHFSQLPLSFYSTPSFRSFLIPRLPLILFHSLFPLFSHSSLPSPFIPLPHFILFSFLAYLSHSIIPLPHSVLFSFLAYLSFYSNPSFRSFLISCLPLSFYYTPSFRFFLIPRLPLILFYTLTLLNPRSSPLIFHFFLPLTLIQTFPFSYTPSILFFLLPHPSSLLPSPPLSSPLRSLSLLPFLSLNPILIS